MNIFYKDKKDIISWLDKYQVKNYTLVPDEKYGFVVDVNGNVNLHGREILYIPIKFNEIKGGFDCHNNELTSLEFSPKLIYQDFYCNDNKLKSLESCPEIVGGVFYCNNNEITSLEYCPKIVGGDYFNCEDNEDLKEVNKIKKFNLIYLEHKKVISSKLLEKLDNSLFRIESKQKLIKL